MKREARHIGYQFILGFALLLVSACDSYLDEAPDNRVDLDDLDKAAQLLTNAYSYGSSAFTDWMSDDFSYTIGTDIRPLHQRLYAWEPTEEEPGRSDTPEFFWYNTYEAIAHANEVLAVIDELPAESEEEMRRRGAIQSEALLSRAYGHFMLVNLFAPHFDQSGGRNLGIPYISKPETTFIATYNRMSVSRVYDEIEDDLVLGIELLDDSFFNNSGKYHFNRNAALAFASRFYLYKRDYARCKQYADELLQSNPEAFVRDFNSEEFRNSRSSISGYPQVYSSPEQTSNLLLMRKFSLFHIPSIAYGIEQNFYSELFATNPFEATDLREDPALVKGENAVFPSRYEILFERSSLNSSTGFPYFIEIAFRGEEVLLNRAEAMAFLGDIDGAVADLQILTNNRYRGDDLVLTMQRIRDFFPGGDSDLFYMINYILLERRKEFIGQGMRWFDIRRYGLGVQHEYADGSFIVLGPDDPRKVLQLPTSAIEVGGLEPNDRD